MQVSSEDDKMTLQAGNVDEWKVKYETMTEIIRSTLGEKVLSTLIIVTERKMKEKAQQ